MVIKAGRKLGPREQQLRALREAGKLPKGQTILLDEGLPAECIRLPGEKRKPAPTAATGEAKAPVAEARPFDPYAAEHAAHKRQKALGRIAKLLAKQTGETAQMPLQGKAALAAIRSTTPTETSAQHGETKMTTKAKKTKTKKTAKAKSIPKVKRAKGNGSKVALIAEMLKRPSGCSAAEVMKACGWPSVSMPAQAKAAGLKLRSEKVEGSRGRRYFAA